MTGLSLAALVLAGPAVRPATAASEERPARPLLVTVDDLPMSPRFHRDPEDRERLTRAMLAVLRRHGIRAVGLVTWGNVLGDRDRDLLDLWLAEGHELGNHSWGHLDYTRTDTGAYVADVEKARQALADHLSRNGGRVRFFRFPFLREGETPAKLRALRDYLAASGQRNLPVTLDNQDWSFEEPWVAAHRAGDAAGLETVAADYQAAMRIHVRHHEARGDRLLGRPAPQILLLHALEVSAAQWDALFAWLTKSGHRFAAADEVLADPAFSLPHDFAGPRGFGLWDRLWVARGEGEARAAVERVLREQAAAWSRGDLESFCSVYAEDASFVSPSGRVQGRQAVLDRYRRRYPDATAMGTLALEVVEARFAAGYEVSLLGDAVPSRVHGVSVVARWSLSGPGREPASGLTLLVLSPRGETWELVQDASF